MPIKFNMGERFEMECIRITYKKPYKHLHIFAIDMKDVKGDGYVYHFETQSEKNDYSGFEGGQMNKFYVSYLGNYERVEIKPLDSGLPADIPPRNASKQSPALISDYLVTAAFRSAADVYIARVNSGLEEQGIPADKIQQLGNQLLDAMIDARKRVNQE